MKRVTVLKIAAALSFCYITFVIWRLIHTASIYASVCP